MFFSEFGIPHKQTKKEEENLMIVISLMNSSIDFSSRLLYLKVSFVKKRKNWIST
jgi:hypothetical protein